MAGAPPASRLIPKRSGIAVPRACDGGFLNPRRRGGGVGRTHFLDCHSHLTFERASLLRRSLGRGVLNIMHGRGRMFSDPRGVGMGGRKKDESGV